MLTPTRELAIQVADIGGPLLVTGLLVAANVGIYTLSLVPKSRHLDRRGYAGAGGADPAAHSVLMRAFEFEKAVYEVRYEAAHRPDWVAIPLAGLSRIAARLDVATTPLAIPDPHRPGQVYEGWWGTTPEGEVVDHPGDPQVELLDAPGHPDRPPLVAEVALQLADDGGGGEGGELEPSARVEALDGLDQAERRHLDEVVEGLAPVQPLAEDGGHPLELGVALGLHGGPELADAGHHHDEDREPHDVQ